MKRYISFFLSLFILLTTVLLSGCALPSDTSTIFVDAENGNDDASGSRADPLRTLFAAQSKAKALHSEGNADKTVTIYLREGNYVLPEPLELTPEDSYTRWSAYKKEAVTVSGGTKITGWQKSGDGAIWVAAAKDISSRDLFVNGVRAQRARSDDYPDVVSYDAISVTVHCDAVSDLEKPHVMEFVLKHMWNQPRIRAVSASNNQDGTTTFIMAQPGWSTALSTDAMDGTPLPVEDFSYFENAYEFLDEPGEFFLDEDDGLLYYIPRDGEDLSNSDCILGDLEKLITMNGSPEKPVSHVTFSKITFSHTTWLQASSNAGLLTIQANFYKGVGMTEATQWDQDHYWCAPSAAICGTYCSDIELSENTFTNLGNGAVHLGRGTKNANISKNTLTDCAGSGIMVGAFTNEDHNCIVKGGSNLKDNWYMISENNLIADNSIHNVASVYAGGVGIAVGYVRNTTVTHNELIHLPYTAISFGWGWGFNGQELRDTYYTDENGINLYSNNEISNNYISDVMNVLFDGGGIYTLGRNDNSRITGNYIEKVNNDYGAIYLDDGSVGFTVTNNVIVESYRNYIYKGDRNYIHDNYAIIDTAVEYDYELITPLDVINPDYIFENNYLWDDTKVSSIRRNAGPR